MRAKIVAYYFQSLEILHEKLALSSLRRLTSSCDSAMYSLVPVKCLEVILDYNCLCQLDGLDNFNHFQSNMSHKVRLVYALYLQ